MSLTDSRAALVTILDDIDYVENVNDFEKDTTDERDADSFVRDSTGRVNTWFISSSERKPVYYASRIVERFYEFTLVFYYGKTDVDETQKTVEELVSDVIKVLYTNRTLNNTATEATVESSEIYEITIGGVKCHKGIIILVASELDQGVEYE